MSIALRVLGIILIVISLLLLIAVPLAGVIGLLFGVLCIIRSSKKLTDKIGTGITKSKEKSEQREKRLKEKYEESLRKQKELESQIASVKNIQNSESQSIKESPKDIVPTKTGIQIFPIKNFILHEDIKSLLWFGDGALKNLTKEQMSNGRKDEFTTMGGRIKISIFISTGEEPSLIYVNAPINKPNDESIIPRPPYFPKYRDLTPEQRWIYLKLLTNPYNTDIDIGYVFILYYGLERQLLQGDFHSAFNVILKLRDVHKNKSFQSYSGNALILSALLKGKGEYVPLFIQSLDKEYEFGFSDNLLLLSYFSFNVPLFPKDIIRMAKTFEFTNTNYIKKNPDIYEKCLIEIIKEKTGMEQIDVKNYITDAELQKIRYGNTSIFANTSIVENTIPVPLLSDNLKLKKEMNAFLEAAHEKTKSKLAEMRKK